MNAQDLRTLLEQTNDKLSILANFRILAEYKMTDQEFLDLILVNNFYY